MSKELDAPKLPNGTYPELSPNPNSKGVELKDGGRGTPVVVNTEPRKSNTNTITVDEVKRLIREAIDHFEKEEGGVTEAEMESYVADAIASKADKVGGLPFFEINANTEIVSFVTNNNLNEKPFVFKYKNGDICCIGRLMKVSPSDPIYDFEFEELVDSLRWTGANVDLTGRAFDNIVKSNSPYEQKYALEKEVSKIHNYAEGTILTDTIWNRFKTGDILKVNNMQFIINVFETTGEGAYKGVTGTMVGAVTSNSITIASIDWRTVGEGYTELEPTLTTLTIGGNE